MKFAKQLEAQTIEEWKFKYIQYKQLKKIIKKGIAVVGLAAQTDNDMHFTAALDAEIQKVQEFYFDRLGKASKQKEAIQQQLQEWDHEFTTAQDALNNDSDKHPNSDSEEGHNKANDGEHHGEVSKTDDVDEMLLHAQAIENLQTSAKLSPLPPPPPPLSNGSSPPMRPGALTRRHSNHHQQPRSNSTNISPSLSPPHSLLKRGSSFTHSPASCSHSLVLTSPLEHHRPEHSQPIATLTFTKYSSLAKLRIRKALIELFRSLELLRSYRSLNILAYTKIVKKFEKNTRRNIGDQLMEELRKSTFHNSMELDTLLGEVENLFKRYFEKENPKKCFTNIA